MNGDSMPTQATLREHLPDGPIALDRETVHVWSARLKEFAGQTARLLRLLSPDERDRAERFHFTKDREHFIAARSLLRILLSRYLDSPPHQLSFNYNPYGKPALAGHDGSLRFNLSHSNGIALYAFTREREVGIDVEYIRRDVVEEAVAERFFSAQEVKSLRSLPAEVQPQAFFNCWTRKEAFIKAIGEGLSYPLDEFDVSLIPEEPAALLGTRNDPPEAARWSLSALPVDEGYAAALAVEGHGWRLECRTLHSSFVPADIV